MCWVDKFAEGVNCSFLPAKSIVEPAADAPEVVRHHLWCRLLVTGYAQQGAARSQIAIL